MPSWTSWKVKGVASTTRASPSHGGKAFVDSRESLKVVPSWTSRRTRIRNVKIVSGGSKCIRKGFPEGANRIRRVKVGPGRVVPEAQNRIRVAFGSSLKIASGWSKRIRRAVPEGKNRIRKLKVVPGTAFEESFGASHSRGHLS